MNKDWKARLEIANPFNLKYSKIISGYVLFLHIAPFHLADNTD